MEKEIDSKNIDHMHEVLHPKDRNYLTCSKCKKEERYEKAQLKLQPLYGDCYYTYICEDCGGGKCVYKRLQISWVQAVHLIMYHLKVASPETKYFKWREHICTTFDKYWDYLIPEKTRTQTWHNTVAGCISTHNALFKSGFEETNQTGYWSLRTLVKPAVGGFKFNTRLKNPTIEQRIKQQKKNENKKSKTASKAAKKSKGRDLVPEKKEIGGAGSTTVYDGRPGLWVGSGYFGTMEHQGTLTELALDLDEEIRKTLSRKVISDESSLSEGDLTGWSSDSSLDDYLMNRTLTHKSNRGDLSKTDQLLSKISLGNDI